jgi:8-oxo-dGTP pyrophosphatase MutT (NUDIX family)
MKASDSFGFCMRMPEIARRSPPTEMDDMAAWRDGSRHSNDTPEFMTLLHWEKRSERVAFRNPWWTYKIDGVTLPDGREGEYHYVHTEGSVMIIPFATDGRILLVEQHRYLNRRNSLEFPGGGIPAGMDAAAAAQKELSEETGFAAGDLALLGVFNPYNGVTDELCSVYLARRLTPCEATPDETEDLRVHPVMPDHIDTLVADRMIWDGMTLAAWQLYHIHRRKDDRTDARELNAP